MRYFAGKASENKIQVASILISDGEVRDKKIEEDSFEWEKIVVRRYVE